jgi:hypothetical protein
MMGPGLTLLVLVNAIIFGFVGYLVGKPKGYPVWGFFLGFFLSLIGLLVIALTRPKAARS